MWYLRGSAQLDSDEEGLSSGDEEEEEDLSGSIGHLNEAEQITDEEFSRLLGRLFVQQGKKRSHPQDMDRAFVDIPPANNKRHQRTALSPAKNEESEGSPSKKETPNLANPSQCVEELRSLSPLSDSFLHMLQRVIKTLPLEFIDEEGIPVLVKRILQDNTASKTRDLLVSCFRSTSKGLEHLLSVRAPRYRSEKERKGGSEKNSEKALFESCESLLFAFEPLTKDLDRFLLDSFYDLLFPGSACSLEIPNPISEVNEQVLTKKKVGQLLEKNCSNDLRWKLESFLFMFQCQGVFQVISKTIPLKHSSIETLLDFGLFLSKLRDVESANKKLLSPLDEVKDTGLLEISASTSLALLQAIVVLVTRKVESCKSQLGSKKPNGNEGKFFKIMKSFVEESEKAIDEFLNELKRLRYIVQKRTKTWREDPSGVGIEGSGEEKKEFLQV